jgi:hypothetical protein
MWNIGSDVPLPNASPLWNCSGTNTMEPYPDFKELLELLNKNEVEYLIVGGYALALLGSPRFTGDLDIYISTHPENAQKVMAVLHEFGFGSLNISTDDLSTENQVIQLGVPPVRIDFVTSIDGIKWEDAWKNREQGEWGNIPVDFLGRNDFITNKRASGRLKDLADIEALGETP